MTRIDLTRPHNLVNIMRSSDDNIELVFDSTCYNKCSYCGPQFSSLWARELDNWGRYPSGIIHTGFLDSTLRHNGDDNQVDPTDSFWDTWPSIFPRLKSIHVTGGDPLLSPNMYALFDYILASPHPALSVSTQSALIVPPKDFARYLDYVDRLCKTQIHKFTQYVTVYSGIPSHAAYIRNGIPNPSNYAFSVHPFSLLNSVNQKCLLNFTVTLNNLSIIGFGSLLSQVHELRRRYPGRVSLTATPLQFPRWHSIQILGPRYASILEQDLKYMTATNFPADEIEQVKKAYDFMTTPIPSEEIIAARRDFFMFFHTRDVRHNSNFVHTFPQMTQFWLECKHHASSTIEI